MARNVGKRNHEVALELLKKKGTVTPTELENYVNKGPYSSKYVWALRKLGVDITANKDGKNVVSYTLNGIGSYVEPVVPEKKEKVTKAKATKVKAKKEVVEEVEDAVTDDEDASFIDPDFDANEDVYIKNLVA